jgi:hypothetical protein
MMDPAIVIFAAADNWRIGIAGPGGASVSDVPIAAGASPDDIAGAVADALDATAGPGKRAGVMLALPADRCLCASVRVDDLPARDRRLAMLYRLEEKLPLPAEDVVADFIPAGAATTLGVCVETAYARPLVEALESHGMSIDAICPASLLALQRRLLDAAHRGEPAPDAVVWSSGGRVELFVLRGGVVRGWSVFSDDPQDLRLNLGLEPLTDGGPARVHAIGLSDPSHRAIGSLPGVELIAPGPAAIDADATLMAADVLAGRAQPWVNLRRDALAERDRLRSVRTPILFAAAAAILCVACISGGMLWRAARYDRLAARYTAEQQQTFQHVFPSQPIPPDVRSRLASEERALRAISGTGGVGGVGDPASADAPPPEAPGLVVLRDLLAGLPADLRYRVLEARLDGGRFTLEGQVNAHGDADTIASALRAHKGLTVEPPRTEQLPESASGEKAVAFTISGTVAVDQPSAIAAGAGRAGS